ncbi:shikimate dehydrogenase [Bacillus ectoiniformans]|uniref:shikimate dehydrogenase n=1 Tax=Bacillus ectoiniformans TaxID=1494429 RepID=UPI001957AD9A|nr:shikimate dehydrogenase [Bacillus ectoiniformans]MBM7649964.1 shikimate dehydrogenase [Bacillus ectoiniformans]
MKKIFGVIGDPIGHSMSPAMHNDAFERIGMDASYLPFHVTKENLADAVKGMKAIGVQGFNVTIPHKTEIIPLLDEVDPLASVIGAVNTVVREKGRFKGYNTDGLGYVRALRESFPGSIEDQRVLIIGAGGAARGIYYTLASEKVTQMDVANRTVDKAKQLSDACPYPVDGVSLTLEAAAAQLETYDIIIQTTSIGMAPAIDQKPISLDRLKQGAFVSDIIYNPLQTELLKEAEERRAGTQNGIQMFVHQGALAFEKWTGVYPDVKRMEELVLKQLGGNYANR